MDKKMQRKICQPIDAASLSDQAADLAIHHTRFGSIYPKHPAGFYLYCIGIALMYASPSALADSTAEPFLFRFSLDLDRQSNYASTLGRQASMAYPDGASMNPAAGDWIQRSGPVKSATVTYVEGRSASGAKIVAAPVSARFQEPGWGSLSVAYAHTDTPSETGWNNLDQALSSDEIFFGFSKRSSSKRSYGVQLHLVDAQFKNEFISPQLGGQSARLRTKFNAYNLAAGLLADFDNGITGGLAGTLGWGKASNKLENVTILALPGPVLLPPGSTLDSFPDIARNAALRGGLGYKPTNKLGVYGDLHITHVDSNLSGSADLARMAIGMEYRPYQRLTWRGGISADTDQQNCLSVGIGYQIGNSVNLDFGYQDNTAPGVRSEFGRFRLFNTSLAVGF